MVTKYFESFISKLREIFMMDETELDFGIYRIMNQKRDEINDFLSHKLLPQVEAILSENSTEDTSAIKNRLKEIETNLGTSDVDSLDVKNVPIFASMVNEYHQLKKKLANTSDAQEMENDVFSHLTTFFSRYYDGGDFISQRRYKDNTYAIPYNGEEVKLYWANADQYYIKTSEYFRNYTFVLPGSKKKVNFVLLDADTELNNNKIDDKKEHRFILYNPETHQYREEKNVIEVNEDGNLNIYFTYEVLPKSKKQADLSKNALKTISELIPAGFEELISVELPTKANPHRTLLEKQLTDYTSKNSFDYFIHKNLGKFLNLELDYYLKNEVLHIDDLDANHITSQLTKVKAIKLVGQKIIDMLAQLENFQKKLWLKKKFVVQCDYCITLDRIPEKLYPEIIANDDQREEWVKLFAIDKIKKNMMDEGYSVPLTMDFLKQNPYLVLDTIFFSNSFKNKLISSIENFDEECNGLLINSENFQGLNLLKERFYQNIKCIYIDPPYNAKSSEILYKNNFKHSSWLSLIENRLNLSRCFFEKNGVSITAIDEVENEKLGLLLDEYLASMFTGKYCISAIINPSGQQGKNFSTNHENLYFYFNDEKNMLAKEKRTEETADVRNFMNGSKGESGDYLRTSGKSCFYPIYVKSDKVIGFGPVCDDSFHPTNKCIEREDGIIEVYPIDSEGVERKWLYGNDTVEEVLPELSVIKKEDNSIEIQRTKTEIVYKTVWTNNKYSAKTYGTSLLTDYFGKKEKVFSFPKSIYAVKDCINIACNKDEKAICLDYFAGSATTGDAIIRLNREDNGQRKYILIEMGTYFSSATKPRIMKTIYSTEWKNGKPLNKNGISQCFKYIRLEQYEDTLNNLEIKDNTGFNFEENDKFHESYMLRYMLDTETKDSLFNLKWFENPFAMTIKTTKDNELVDTNVDMVETFNYLIGLNVKTIDWFKDDNICVVEGTTHKDGYKTLVIWRNCDVINNEELNKFFDKMDYRVTDSEYDLIYVNGDNTLPNLRKDDEHWKVILTEEEFAKRMFEDC